MPVNDVTTNRSYQKPNIANTLSDDVGRLRSALDAIDTDMASKAPSAGPTFTGVATVAAGSAAAPSLTFTGATSDTGLYSPGADQLALSTAGTGRLLVDANGNVAIDTATLYVDAVTNRVGIGTATPLSPLHISNTTSATYFRITAEDAAGNGDRTVNIEAFRSGVGYHNLLFNSNSHIFTTLGTGNEKMRLDSSGRLLVGTSTARTNFFNAASGQTSKVQIEGLNYQDASLAIICNANSADKGTINFAKSRSTSVGGNTLIANADDLGEVTFQGADGTKFVQAVGIKAQVDGTPAAGSVPGRIVLSTTADGASSPTERMRISNAGTTTLTSAASTAPFIANIGASEVARIDSAGRLLVGTSTSVDTNLIQIFNNGIGITSYSADQYAYGNVMFTKSRGTTVSSKTIVSAGDELGGVYFKGADGANYLYGAFIKAEVDGTPGLNDMPGRIILSTTPDGTSSPTEQWRINNAGTVIYRQPAPAAVDTSATLTVGNMTAKIITSTTAAAVTMTLPTGTDMDAGFSGLYTNMAFEWYVINTGGTNAVTVAANTAHTIVGSGTVSANNSGKFLSRRTAATTWVTYRLSS